MNIGNAIKSLRSKQNMTQAELAERLGISVNAVSAWELDKTFPSNNNIKRLCDVFGIPSSLLLLSSIDKEDFPEDKRVLYHAMLEPLKNELIESKS